MKIIGLLSLIELLNHRSLLSLNELLNHRSLLSLNELLIANIHRL